MTFRIPQPLLRAVLALLRGHPGRLPMLGAGLPAPQLQVEIHASRHLVGVVDAWFDDAAVAVEFDGQIKYTDPWRGRSPGRVLWDEKRREDELRALDIRVVRIAEEDLHRRWRHTEARLHELLSQPGPAVRRFTAVPRSRGCGGALHDALRPRRGRRRR